MRSYIRLATAAVAGSAVLLLSGCVVAPAYPGYSSGYGYQGGYYQAAPAYAAAPIVVQPSFGFYGRWGGGRGGYGGRGWRR